MIVSFHRRLSVAALLCGMFIALFAASSEAATVKEALAIEPVQADVPFDQVPEDLINRCRIEDVDEKGVSGWSVIGPDGSVLRRFVDTNEDKRVDSWSYYQFNVEVYRDVDSDYDGKADQYRWFATAGSRHGIDKNEDGKVDSWKRISAEEVAAEVIAAIASRDSSRFDRLLINANQVRSLGLSELKSKSLLGKVARASRGFAETVKSQKKLTAESRFAQFAAAAPGLVPAGTDGSTRDILVYENAVAMFDDEAGGGQIMVGTIIETGDGWRLIELPSIEQDNESIAQSIGNFFTPGGLTSAPAAAPSGEVQKLVSQLEQIDVRLASAKDGKQAASLHEQRSKTLQQLIETASDRNERESWVRQYVDTLSMAVQSGAFPDGISALRQVAKKYAANNTSLAAYADSEAIDAEYVLLQAKEDDFEKVQEWYVDAQEGFVKRYPKTKEAADSYLQLALSKEFEDKERDALSFYKRIAEDYSTTEAADRARGAIRRLSSVGRPIELQGQTLDGKSLSLRQLKGKPVIIHYWASWCGPCKQDMAKLKKLQASYRRAGLQIVGVNVDQSPQMARQYLAQQKLGWPQLFAEGGLQRSPLAQQLGVQLLPTMLLVDASGKVVRHNVRAGELESELDQMLSRKR
ncbi:MAG: redoxin family protein [Planctomycetota bacterium]